MAAYIDVIFGHYLNRSGIYTEGLYSGAVYMCFIACKMPQVTFRQLTAATVPCAKYQYVFHDCAFKFLVNTMADTGLTWLNSDEVCTSTETRTHEKKKKPKQKKKSTAETKNKKSASSSFCLAIASMLLI